MDYELIGDHNALNFFAIDSNGQVTLNNSLHMEEQLVYTVSIYGGFKCTIATILNFLSNLNKFIIV